MLHVIDMIQRRLGDRPGGSRLVARVLLGSLLVLVVGLGLLFSMRADAQEAAPVDGPVIATRPLDRPGSGSRPRADPDPRAACTGAGPRG